MLPQRSQYFSSIRRSCDSVLGFIVPLPLGQRNPCHWHQSEDCWIVDSGKDRGTADDKLDFFAMLCSFMYLLEAMNRSKYPP
jgi:hypothetical protein